MHNTRTSRVAGQSVWADWLFLSRSILGFVTFVVCWYAGMDPAKATQGSIAAALWCVKFSKRHLRRNPSVKVKSSRGRIYKNVFTI